MDSRKISPMIKVACLGLFAICGGCDKKPAPPAETPAAAAPAAEADQPGVPSAAEVAQSPSKVPISAPAMVGAGVAGNKASIDSPNGFQLQWFIQGGTLEGDTEGSEVTFTAGDQGSVKLFCKRTDAMGHAVFSKADIPCVAPPAIDAFDAVPPILTEGSGEVSLGWSAKEIKSLVLDPGGLDVSKTATMKVKPEQSTTYTLTATNLAGVAVKKELTVKVVPAPRIQSFGSEGAVSFGQPLTLVADFANGKAEIKDGDTVLASGTTSPLRVQVTPKEGSTFMLVVTNEAGTAVGRSRSFKSASSGY